VPPVAPEAKPNKLKKIIVAVLAAVGGLLVVIFLIGFVTAMLQGRAPSYSETKQVELKGLSTQDNGGMKFDVPVEMQEDVKTDLSGNYEDYLDDDDKSKGSHGAIAAEIQTVSFLGDLSAEQKDAITKAFQETQFDEGFKQGFEGSTIRNSSISNKKVENNGELLTADLAAEIKVVGDGEEYKSGKGRLIIYVKGRNLYTFAYMFEEEVFNKNQDFLKDIESSIEVGV